MSAETLMFLGGLSAFVLTVYWLIHRQLHEGYALAWLAVATLLLLCGLFPQVIMEFARFSRMSYAGFVLIVSLAVIYSYSFFVSIALSRLRRKNARLTQEVALLESRLRRIELSLVPPAADKEPSVAPPLRCPPSSRRAA